MTRRITAITTTAFCLGLLIGATGFLAVDHIRFLWGSSVADMRHAGWARKDRT